MDFHLENISLRLRDRLVLDSITATLSKGMVTVIMGANGAGKSSFLSCLAALHIPDNGQITLGSERLGNIPVKQRARQIGYLPQQGDIHWDVTVRALVALGRLPFHERWGSTSDDRDAIEHAMIQTDCLAFANRKASRLSGGEQARVLLARVLAGRPDWILADEPLANLDLAHQLDTVACLKQAARAGAGVVIVLHDLTQAARIADQVIILDAGRILAQGPTRETLTTAVIEQAFGIAVQMMSDHNGSAVITPMQRI